MRVRHVEVLLLVGGGIRRLEHASLAFGPSSAGLIRGASACRVTVHILLGDGVGVRLAVDVQFGQSFEDPGLLVAGHVHILHDHLLGFVFVALGQVRRILRLLTGAPHMEGELVRTLAVVVGAVVPVFGHLGADGVRLTHVQHCVFGAVLIRSLGDRHSVGAILELLRGFLVHGVVVAFAVLVVSGQIGPRMRPRAGTIHLDRVPLVGQLLGIAQQMEGDFLRTVPIVRVGPDFAHAHHGGGDAVLHTYGTVALQHTVDVHLASAYGEFERFDRLVSGRGLGFDKRVDAVLEHEPLRRSTAGPCDRVDGFAFECAAGQVEFGTGEFGSAAYRGFGEEDAVGVGLIHHGERPVRLGLAIHGDFAVDVDAERDVIGLRIACRRIGLGQRVGARLQVELLRLPLLGGPCDRIDGFAVKRASRDAHACARDVGDAVRQAVLGDGDAMRLVRVDHSDQAVVRCDVAAVGLSYPDLQLVVGAGVHAEDDVIGLCIPRRSFGFRQRVGARFQCEAPLAAVGSPRLDGEGFRRIVQRSGEPHRRAGEFLPSKTLLGEPHLLIVGMVGVGQGDVAVLVDAVCGDGVAGRHILLHAIGDLHAVLVDGQIGERVGIAPIIGCVQRG